MGGQKFRIICDGADLMRRLFYKQRLPLRSGAVNTFSSLRATISEVLLKLFVSGNQRLDFLAQVIGL